MNISDVRKQIETEYRKTKKTLMRKELQNHETPTEDLRQDVSDLKGYMRGLMKALGYVESYQNGTELPLDQEAV